MKKTNVANKSRLYNVTLALIVILAAVAFVFVFSCSTSPFYKYYVGGDSSFFLLMGKGWSLGKIPYKDMFDHKGPYIFLVDMIGWLFTGTRYGVMFIQIPCLILTVYFFTKIASLFSDNLVYRLSAAIITLTVLTENYMEGNLTEEYCLPYLAASLFYIAKYFYMQTDNEHDAKCAFLYGVTSGICLMTRATNAVYIGVAAIVIAVNLIIKKYYRNLWNNIFLFLGGMAIVVIPFVVYFCVKGAFTQFWNATFVQNAEYAKYLESWTKGAGLSAYKTFIRRDFAALCIVPTGILALIRKKYPLFAFCAVSALLEIYILISGAMFAQYAMVEIPQVLLLLNELMFGAKRILGEENKKALLALVGVVLLYAILVLSKRIYSADQLMMKCSSYNPVGYESLIEQIPDEDKDSFVTYSYGYMKEPYLLHDMMFCNKHFILQGWHMKNTPSIVADLREDFGQCKAKWILTADYTEAIEDILDENYSLYDETEGFQLYKRNF